jgi:hypothetical protein
MKQPLKEFKRMQQLAGVIIESQLNENIPSSFPTQKAWELWLKLSKENEIEDYDLNDFNHLQVGSFLKELQWIESNKDKYSDEELSQEFSNYLDGIDYSQLNEAEENAIEVAFQSSSKMVPWNVIEKTYTESGLTGEEFFADVEDEFRSKFENKPVNRDEYYKFFIEQPNVGGQDDLYTMVNWINFTNPKLADKLYNMI